MSKFSITQKLDQRNQLVLTDCVCLLKLPPREIKTEELKLCGPDEVTGGKIPL